VPITVTLEGLSKEALVRILTEPRNALVKQYQKLFDFDNVKLTFEEEAVHRIAEMAYERETGARGLRSIMEKSMMDVMYEIPSDDTISECVITDACVDGTSQPLIVRGKESKKLKPAK
jgi:ATP-dependent Clp protease ATP-binding subunit ClpX